MAIDKHIMEEYSKNNEEADQWQSVHSGNYNNETFLSIQWNQKIIYHLINQIPEAVLLTSANKVCRYCKKDSTIYKYPEFFAFEMSKQNRNCQVILSIV